VSSILFHAREAGVATMILALEEYLQDQGFNLFYDVDEHAADILTNKRHGTIEEVDIIICGYDSAKTDRTGKFLRTVKKTIPTIGLLDSWKGVDRFWYPNGELRPLTDLLIVPDENIRDYLKNKGMPDKLLIALAHPYIEKLKNTTLSKRKESNSKMRSHFRLKDDEKVMLLLSEPLHSKTGGYISLLTKDVSNGQDIIQWLNNQYGMKYKLAVRLHPLEETTVPAEWLNISSIDFDDALALADKVSGLGSTSLAYAVAYGLDVRCLDKEIKDWIPESSDIPSLLWDGLIDNGVFQNQPDRVRNITMSASKLRSFACITNEINRMLV